MALARSRPDVPAGFALVAQDLAVGRGGRTVLTGVTFRLAPGEAVEVTGPNGAGKSTLLRALAGLARPLAGHVRVDGAGHEASLSGHVHFLGHGDGLKLGLSAEENLAFAAALLGAAGGLRPPDALEAVGMGALADLPVAVLSAGQRRRVALARLLVAHRPVWLLDEPLTALDAGAQDDLRVLLEAHRARGGLVMAATHAALGLGAARTMRLGQP